MRKLFTFFGIFMVSLSLTLAAVDANAAKFGGSRSLGKSYRTAPARQAEPANAFKPNAAPNNPATANQPKRGLFGGMMGGMLGGLLAGGLLSWMLGNGAFQGLQFMDILLFAGLAFVAFKVFGYLRQNKAPRGVQSGPTYAAQGPFSMPAPTDTATAQTYQSPASSTTTSATGNGFSDVPLDLPPGFDLPAFLSGSRDHYRTLQLAWNQNDLAKIQEYVSPELYNALVEERKLHPGEQHTEVMFVDAELVRAEHNASWAQVSVRFSGRYRDSHEGAEEPINEIWHLERDLTRQGAPWFIVGIEQ